MQGDQPTVLTLPADVVPAALHDFLAGVGSQAVLASMELLPDGQIVVQMVPDIDPRLVARVRRTMAQYDDVLRRLS